MLQLQRANVAKTSIMNIKSEYLDITKYKTKQEHMFTTAGGRSKQQLRRTQGIRINARNTKRNECLQTATIPDVTVKCEGVNIVLFLAHNVLTVKTSMIVPVF